MYGYLVDLLTTKGTKLFSKELCLPLRTLRKALRFSKDVCIPIRTLRKALRFTKVLLDVLDSLPLRT